MAATGKERDPRTVTLKGVTLSFTDGIKDKKKTSDADDAKPKHNFNVINAPENNPHYEKNNALIVSALKAAGLKAWKQEDAYKTIAEDNPKRVCFKKAEKFKNREGQIYAGYDKGGYAFSVTGPSGGQRRPVLRDRHKRPVEEEDIMDVFYGGVVGDVIVSFYGTDKGSRGIFCTCELVRSHQVGERMGGGFYLDDDDLAELDDFEDDGLEDELGGASSDTDDLLG